jgi:hypothetical protein
MDARREGRRNITIENAAEMSGQNLSGFFEARRDA